MKATSSRRQIIVFVLLGLALVGAAMRQWADTPSLARDIGTLLLVLWLPIIGNVVAFVIQRVHAARRARRPAGFAIDSPFIPHLRVAIQPLGGAPVPAQDARNCTLVLGQDGFTARAALPLTQCLAAAPAPADLQLLRPDLALERFAAGTPFGILVGNALVAQGCVLTVASWRGKGTR